MWAFMHAETSVIVSDLPADAQGKDYRMVWVDDSQPAHPILTIEDD